MDSLFEAILLGFVQGITEFIPVSSSGHLEIIRQIFGFGGENFHLFLEFINLGTLFALLVFFRQKIWKICKNVFLEKNYKLALNILITSIPAGIIGLVLADFIEENGFFSSLYTICIAMGVVGLIMMAIDKLPHFSKLSSENELTPLRALGIGILQTFALIPGVSRSGSTIIAGRIMGMNSENSAEYSFLASIPIFCGVCLKLFLEESGRVYFMENLNLLLISNLAAAIVGLLALGFMLKYLKQPRSLQSFGKYRVILACIMLGVMMILA